MITKVTKDNKGLYRALFEKASIRLNEEAEVGADEIVISSLDDYFCALKSLTDLESTEKLDHLFSTLPLDEPLFEIDANTRVITVPSEFKKNGISVKGDQIAETLFFSIDRYYDIIDLAGNDIKVLIQCEDAGGKLYLYDVTGSKDINILKNEGKLLFGWGLDNIITNKSGTIKFSVRFLRTAANPVTGEQEITFSLSTLTTNAIINPGLDFAFENGESSVGLINNLSIIKNRIQDSVSYDDAAHAEVPSFIVDIPVLTDIFDSVVEDGITYQLVDLNNGTYQLVAQATSDDAGVITYEWHRADLGSGISGDSINGESDYVKTTDVIWVGDYTYYTHSVVNNADVYTPFTNYRIGDTIPVGEEYPSYYIKVSSVTAARTGNYWVVAKNRKGTATATKPSTYVRIPGPGELSVAVVDTLTIDDNDNLQVHLNNDGEFELRVTGSTTRLGNDNGIGDKITYTLSELITTIINEEEVVTPTIVENMGNQDNGAAFIYTSTINENNRNVFDKVYEVKTVASRNGDTTETISKKFRVTDKAHKPTVTLGVNPIIYIGEGETAHLAIEVSTVGIVSDSLSYQWYKYTRDTEDDDYLIEGATESELDVNLQGAYYCKVTNHVNGTSSTYVPTREDYINVMVS